MSLQSPRDIADRISRALPRVKSGSLVVFGDIFGGRIDNIHRVVAADVAPVSGQLRVQFNHGETLEVWDPVESEIGPNAFKIARASRVRWEWLYYGEADRPENHVFVEHNVVGGRVEVSTNAPHRDQSSASIDLAAVELVSVADEMLGR